MKKALLADLTPANVVDKLEALFEAIAETSYLGEPVTIADHMLQAAACARRDGASDALTAAALLHDVGYYADANPDNENEADARKRHDAAAARILAPVLPEAVTEPIRLHVDAKRYLCAVEPDYRAKLSPASIHTMSLQGGVMSRPDAASFAAEPYCEDAVRLRRWDDEGKQPETDMPGFANYRAMLEALVRARA
jgi:phosphonate degradation associated HDIG domain protein